MSDWYLSDPSGRALIDLAAGRDIDPARLDGFDTATLAHRHGLMVPLARALREEESGRYLDAVVARSQARESVLLTHLRQLLMALHDKGVRVSIVKGPVVANRYRDPTVRTYTDLDLVVPENELAGALEVFRAYEEIGVIPAKQPMGQKRDIVVRDPSGVHFAVDLHWDLFGFHQLVGSASGAMEEAWARSKFVPEHPLGPHWQLPIGAELSFLGLHAVLDHRFRLILFRDLLEVAISAPSWGEVADFASRYRLAGLHRLAWLIAQHTVGAEPPAAFLSQLAVGGVPGYVAERYLAKVDLVRFDGHRAHPLNLALMLVHDDAARRRRLIARAPLAYPRWRSRVQESAPVMTDSVDVLVTSDARRGAEVFGRALADKLVERGWAASLVALQGGASPAVGALALVTDARLDGIKPGVLTALIRRYRRARPAVVFANGGATLRYAVAARLLTVNGPRVVYGSIGEPKFWLRGARHRRLQRMLINRCAHVTAVSQATAADLVEHLGVEESKVTVVHPGVDDRWFELERQWDDGRPLHVLFAGSLSFEKDPLTAVEAVSRLRGEVEMRVVGDGPLRGDLEALRHEWLTVVGTVDDMPAEMQWADVLLLTSLTEGLPGVVVEASASGIPVVASGVGGTGEIVESGASGYLLPPGDVDGFARALQRLMDDRELLPRLGKEARHRAQQFRLAESVSGYEKVFRQVAEQ